MLTTYIKPENFSDVEIEETLGHGNCAFNAFILALTKEEVLNAIAKNFLKRNETANLNEHFRDFLNAAGKALKIDHPIWFVVRAKMLKLRKENPIELQTKLNGVMRELAYQLGAREPDCSIEMKRTEEEIQSLFYQFICEKCGFPEEGGVQDDIFSGFKFIEKDFYNIYKRIPERIIKSFKELKKQERLQSDALQKARKEHSEQVLELEKQLNETNGLLEQVEFEFREDVLKWWGSPPSEEKKVNWWHHHYHGWWHEPTAGYFQFLDEMRKDTVWAGDLELRRLAAYFDVNIDVAKPGSRYRMASNNGSIEKQAIFDLIQDPNQAALVINQLCNRNVIDRPQWFSNKLDFYENDDASVAARLGAVPDRDKFDLIQYLNNIQKINATRFAELVKRGELTPEQAQQNPTIKGTLLPKECTADCIRELQIRDMIDPCENGYKFKLDFDETMNRIMEIPYKEALLKVWETHYRKNVPVLTLANDNAIHWSNTRQKVKAPAPISLPNPQPVTQDLRNVEYAFSRLFKAEQAQNAELTKVPARDILPRSAPSRFNKM